MKSSWGPEPLGRQDSILAGSLASILPPKWPQGRPKKLQMDLNGAKETSNGAKWSQKDVKFLEKTMWKSALILISLFIRRTSQKGCKNKSEIYPNSMPKLMSNTSGGEKCDMQSDRENTYDSSLFSNIEVIKNNENHYKNMLKIHSYTKSA